MSDHIDLFLGREFTDDIQKLRVIVDSCGKYDRGSGAETDQVQVIDGTEGLQIPANGTVVDQEGISM